MNTLTPEDTKCPAQRWARQQDTPYILYLLTTSLLTIMIQLGIKCRLIILVVVLVPAIHLMDRKLMDMEQQPLDTTMSRLLEFILGHYTLPI